MHPRLSQITVCCLGIASALAAVSSEVAKAQGSVGYGQYQQGAGAPAPRMRDIFAASLAAALTGVGSSAISAVAQGVTGGLNSWFQRKGMQAAGGQAMGLAPAGPASYPGASPNPGYPGAPDANAAYPGTGDANAGSAYPGTNGGYPGANGGTPGASSDASPAPSPAYPGSVTPMNQPGQTSDPGIYAGVAFEVQALRPGGSVVRIDPASYVFRTGDRFRVDYRPSLPGQVDVFNTNAMGQSTQIDSVSVGGGALVSLGPYEFSATTGREILTLRLSACSTPTLMTQTRDIVKVQSGGGTASLQLAGCDSPTTTRRLKAKPKTRDIRKVSVEDGTSFAMDPLSPAELASGQLAPREVTITLEHR